MEEIIVQASRRDTTGKQVKVLRRRTKEARGQMEFHDGHVEAINIPYLLAVPEATLQLMSLFVSMLALGLLVARL